VQHRPAGTHRVRDGAALNPFEALFSDDVCGEANVIEAPKPSEIENVLAMDDPQPFPVAIFTAFNAVVTAWHITDWLWQSGKERRQVLAKRYKFNYAETDTSIKKGFEKFQNATVQDCRALYVCRQIANGSKHMRRKKADLDVKAKAEWHKALEKVGVINVGDYVMSMTITDGAETLDLIRLFIDTFGYWEKLFHEENWITKEKRLPDKIIRVPNATAASATPNDAGSHP
jgi:hypothetical protein